MCSAGYSPAKQLGGESARTEADSGLASRRDLDEITIGTHTGLHHRDLSHPDKALGDLVSRCDHLQLNTRTPEPGEDRSKETQPRGRDEGQVQAVREGRFNQTGKETVPQQHLAVHPG